MIYDVMCHVLCNVPLLPGLDFVFFGPLRALCMWAPPRRPSQPAIPPPSATPVFPRASKETISWRSCSNGRRSARAPPSGPFGEGVKFRTFRVRSPQRQRTAQVLPLGHLWPDWGPAPLGVGEYVGAPGNVFPYFPPVVPPFPHAWFVDTVHMHVYPRIVCGHYAYL